jgi:DNA repair exonuclease SbcCD nuclease subunit
MHSRTLVIGDTHLKNISVIPGYIRAQTECLINILEKEEFDQVIFLGDIFHNRKPTPTEMLEFRYVLKALRPHQKAILLRGNHESETKADDGVTCLTLFKNSQVSVFEHVGADATLGYYFIPHYENQALIEEHLADVPDNFIVFGHFGYAGAFNSAGDADFSIQRASFRNQTFLGHVHRFRQESKVTVLGTPFTTNYQEVGKKSYYGIIEHAEKGWSFSKEEITCGPRHLAFNYSELEGNKEFIKDSRYFNLLRVYVDELTMIPDTGTIQQIKEEYGVKHVDVKFSAIQETKYEEQSTFIPTEEVFQITPDLIEKYVEENNTALPKEAIMRGLQTLKNEETN